MSKKMSRESWISAKIAKLIKEGKPQKQAEAIAISMWSQLNKKRKK